MNLYRSAGVHKPTEEGKCWGLTAHLGLCEKNARPGKLTCWHHQNAEREAQKLKLAMERKAKE
jgi:hypothetical protein